VQQVGGGRQEKLPVHDLANRIVQLQAILVGGLLGLPGGTNGFHSLGFTGLTLRKTANKTFLTVIFKSFFYRGPGKSDQRTGSNRIAGRPARNTARAWASSIGSFREKSTEKS
jgi:hypothetical protein